MTQRRNGQGWSVPEGEAVERPDPRDLEAGSRAQWIARRERETLAEQEEEWAAERLRLTHLAAVDAAREEWAALGGNPAEMPYLAFVSPGEDPLNGLVDRESFVARVMGKGFGPRKPA